MRKITLNATGTLIIFCLLVTIQLSTASNASSAVVTGSTSMTVVNVTRWSSSNGEIASWKETEYIDNYRANGSGAFWDIEGGRFSFPRLSGTSVTGVIWVVKSYDANKTFYAKSWDYIGNTTTFKHLGYESAPENWLGMAISTLCKPGECNGEKRTNVIFTTQTR